MNPLLNQPIELYKTFEKSVQGDEAATRRLMKEGHPQWAAFSNGILGDKEAVMWLLKNGYPEMGVLANGMDDEPHALAWLRAHPDPFYYAFCQATKKEKGAVKYLEDNGYIAFLILAETIRKAVRMRIKKELFWYKIDW